jgi:hypothetical protein
MTVFDVATLGGFLLSLWILARTYQLSGRLRRYNDIRRFNESRTVRHDTLCGLLETVKGDGIVDWQLVSSLLKEIEFGKGLRYTMTWRDRMAFTSLSRYLGRDNERVKARKLCRKVARCAAVYDRPQEEIF